MNKKREPTKYERQAQERIIYIIERHCNGNQQLFADMVGINKASVSQYVNGKNVPSNKTAAKIGNKYGYNPAWVNGFDVPMRSKDPPADNLFLPDAYSIPILGQISCGNGVFLEDSFQGEFVVDRSIRADYCLIAKGDSMVTAGIEDGDKVFIRKCYEITDGNIYAVIVRGEDISVLKRIYRQKEQLILQPCNPDYSPLILHQDEVFIVGEAIGVYKNINKKPPVISHIE